MPPAADLDTIRTPQKCRMLSRFNRYCEAWRRTNRHILVLTKSCGRSDTLLSNAVKTECNLNDLMRVIRDIFVEEFGFDRAGVFSYDAVTDTMRGSWGTDPLGVLED